MLDKVQEIIRCHNLDFGNNFTILILGSHCNTMPEMPHRGEINCNFYCVLKRVTNL